MTQTNQDIGRRMGALVLIGVGVLFLLGFDIFGFGWPLIVMLPGLAFLYFAFTGDKNAAGLAVPGAIVTGTGAILFYQNMTDHWESWAYIWALYPVFLGLALTFMGERTHSVDTAKAGRGFIRWGGIAFVALWALFELVIFSGDKPFGNFLLPAVLIGAGAWMLFRSGNGEKAKHTGLRVITSKRKNGYAPSASEKLQREIDAALAEDDEPTMV